jgi:hypothetical protein
MDAIDAAFKLSKNTVHARVLEVLDRVHDPLVMRFVAAQARAPLPLRGEHPACGFIIDATIQNRGRPVGTFEEAITNRDGLAVHIVAGVPGAKHDFQLFQDNLAAIEELIVSHPRELSNILADNGYAGDVSVRGPWCLSSRTKRGLVCPLARVRGARTPSSHGTV